MLVTALARAAADAGGFATVLAKGDPVAGALLLALAERGVVTALVERAPAWGGGPAWLAVGPDAPNAPGALSDYIARRRRTDPDLWAVEIDAPDARALVDRVTG